MNDFGVLFHQNAKTSFSNSTISKIASRYCGGFAPYTQELALERIFVSQKERYLP